MSSTNGLWERLVNEVPTPYVGIPDGDYELIITECEAKQAQSGKVMYAATCKVEIGPHKDRLVWHPFVVSPENPNALSVFFRDMKVLGLGREFFNTCPSDDLVAQTLVGKRFRGQVTTRSWKNVDRNEIKKFSPAHVSATELAVAVKRLAEELRVIEAYVDRLNNKDLA